MPPPPKKIKKSIFPALSLPHLWEARTLQCSNEVTEEGNKKKKIRKEKEEGREGERGNSVPEIRGRRAFVGHPASITLALPARGRGSGVPL